MIVVVISDSSDELPFEQIARDVYGAAICWQAVKALERAEGLGVCDVFGPL
jgi:hypothetical protein